MMKAIDSKGNVIPYISRGPGGGLIVSDKMRKQEYLVKKEDSERLNRVEKDISELKEMMREILKRM